MQDTDCQLFSESVFGEMTVGRTSSPALREKAEEILNDLGLWQYRERHPASLSGGEKQRLTLGVALMQETNLLILDEPTSGLDGRNLEKVIRCVSRQATTGRTIIVITHDYELVQKACSRMIYLENGTVAKDFSLSKGTFDMMIGCLSANHERE